MLSKAFSVCTGSQGGQARAEAKHVRQRKSLRNKIPLDDASLVEYPHLRGAAWAMDETQLQQQSPPAPTPSGLERARRRGVQFVLLGILVYEHLAALVAAPLLSVRALCPVSVVLFVTKNPVQDPSVSYFLKHRVFYGVIHGS